ncbi:hypothetical protein [Plantactinospora sp. CA-290183]|uniref:hypothetical protein n=1 Tax=Plantactinospora sp. CA-290183 TaxID=3240006 RepID=UPI003D8D431F
MKNLLWLLLVVAVVANAAVSVVAPGGAGQIVLNVGTGLTALAALGGLVAVYRRQRGTGESSTRG